MKSCQGKTTQTDQGWRFAGRLLAMRPDSSVVLAVLLAACLLAAFAAWAEDDAVTAAKIRAVVVELDQAYAKQETAIAEE